MSREGSLGQAAPADRPPTQAAPAHSLGTAAAREQIDAYALRSFDASSPSAGLAHAVPPGMLPLPTADRERYAPIRDNGVVATAQNPFSTFSIDVDTGSYANVRRFLNSGRLPPPDAVRVEEMVNYFPYHYAEPAGAGAGRAPFGFTTEVAATPWNPDTLLLRVGINPILLATDGDFSVGVTDFAQLKGMVEERRRSGVSLSTLGFGEGNYREDLMKAGTLSPSPTLRSAFLTAIPSKKRLPTVETPSKQPSPRSRRRSSPCPLRKVVA